MTLSRSLSRSALFGALALGAGLLGGCGDDDDGPSFAHSGYYAITSWTVNEAGCDAEGASVLDQKTDESLLAMDAVEQEFLVKFTTIQVVTCGDAQTCSNSVASGNIFGSAFGQSWSFDLTERDGGWESESASAIPPREGETTCDGTVTKYRLTVGEDGVARMETRTFRDLTWEAADDPDFGGLTCVGIDDGRVEQAVAASTCNELEVITAGSPMELPPPMDSM